MINNSKVKNLESKLNKLDLIREEKERAICRMFPNDKDFFEFDGTLIPESYLKRIIGD